MTIFVRRPRRVIASAQRVSGHLVRRLEGGALMVLGRLAGLGSVGIILWCTSCPWVV